MSLAGQPDFGLVLLALGLIAAGLASGFLAGLFGIGGGAVMVPALFETFGVLGVPPEVRMHLTIGTSLAAMSATTIRSFMAHKAKGAVDLAFLKRVVPWVLLGVVFGALVAHAVTGGTLQWIWGILGTLLALKLALGRDDWRLGNELPKGPLVPLWSTAVGLSSTLMSIGGTAFMTTLMTLYGRALLPSLATCSGLGPMIGIPGALGLAWAGIGAPGLPPGSLGYVNLIGLALVVPAGVLAAPWGVRVAHGIPKRMLELAFAALLASVSWRIVLGGS